MHQLILCIQYRALRHIYICLFYSGQYLVENEKVYKNIWKNAILYSNYKLTDCPMA